MVLTSVHQFDKFMLYEIYSVFQWLQVFLSAKKNYNSIKLNIYDHRELANGNRVENFLFHWVNVHRPFF